MITASLVKELRELSGAGMMDCKKALEESNGDINQAQDWLKEHGISKAAKKAARIAAEGLAGIYQNDTKAVILEINSETDFVAKNDEFKEMLPAIGNAILNADVKTMDEALELKINDETIKDYMVSKVAKIGENLSFRRFEVIEKANDEVFGSYIHMGGKIATLALIKGDNQDVAKDVAMQSAAMNPRYVFESDITEDDLAREREALKAQAIEEGMAPEIAEKATAGRMKKFYEEQCLVDQKFIKDDKLTVQKYLEQNNASLVKVVRYEVGEGLEHKDENLADEVAKQLADVQNK